VNVGVLETPNTKENFDLAHGGRQTLTADKLHKSNTKDNTGLTWRRARVKGIRPRMSEVSDAAAVWLFPQ